MQKSRRLLDSSTGKVVAIGASVALLVLAGYIVFQNIGGDTPATARHTMFICTETRKPFNHENKIGETQPILSPHSGKNTGVPAERHRHGGLLRLARHGHHEDGLLRHRADVPGRDRPLRQ